MPRYLMDYALLRRWEEKTAFKGVYRPSRAAQWTKKIPWTGVCFFFFCAIFFGIDFAAGMKTTVEQLRQGKLDKESKLVLKHHEQRKWSMEEGRKFRDGEMATKIEEEKKKVQDALTRLNSASSGGYEGPTRL
jgi:hypothetical protein